jgi:hypothetical protein
MPFTGAVMQPHELEIAQGVFKVIAAESWFDRSTANEKAFATFVLRTYREGVTDPERLYSYCLLVAKERFSS